jgi:hypothetical protein
LKDDKPQRSTAEDGESSFVICHLSFCI